METYYHATPSAHVESILENGLKATKFSKYGIDSDSYPADIGIFACPTMQAAIEWIELLQPEYEDWQILKITLPNDEFDTVPDPNADGCPDSHLICTPTGLPPEHIEVASDVLKHPLPFPQDE